uniref:two component sensor kinase n=1 Tax=Pseudoerythrocladia kornmannii TaxID=753682 RepID=UPI001BF171F3|nr:two component sensor kinase [Pseudoerythrocladia kornmannii]QUE28315.1 dfr [Pseudoerythrocladia kornmannii]UNJ16819.1 two component sensor kinase [Pseudoerythrocladia kornmannii]
MIISTLLISLIMSGLSFWALDSIKKETKITDKHFVQDLSLLLTTNVLPLIEQGLYENLISVSQRFYNGTSSIRYIIYLDDEGEIYYSVPFFTSKKIFNFELSQSNFFQEIQEVNLLIQQNDQQSAVEITNIFLDLYSDNQSIGFLILGLNPNPTIVNSSRLTINLSVTVFFSIWLIVVFGAAFNTLSITRPINELLLGVKNISAGQFYKRIDLPFEGDLGELINNFNHMAYKLQSYKEQNLEELTAEKTKLEILVSRIADGAILLNTSLKVMLINPTAIKSLNLGSIPVEGKKITDCLSLEINEQLLPLLEYLMSLSPESSNSFKTQELSIKLYSDQTKTIRILLNLVINQNRTVIKGIVMTIQDITKETELNEAKGKFISNVSHELRTPLFNILSFLETLHEYDETLSTEEKLEFLDIANKETKRLTRLVNDVLDLSRLESDREYQFDYFELFLVFEQVIRSYQITAKEKNIDICVEIDPIITKVYGNYDLILQSILNIVGNAIKFTHVGETIVIRAATIELYNTAKIRVEISDAGIGIEFLQQQQIFERFLRIENSTHRLRGTGLGLAIVKNCIDKHTSQIFVKSERNNGTTFWFDL